MKEEDIPPEWMWPFDDLLTEWFDDLREAQEHPEDQDNRTVVPQMANELAQDRG